MLNILQAAKEQSLTEMSRSLAKLLLDEPSEIDFLSFGAVASTVVDALLDKSLDPIALGLSGSWGSGKTTVLRLIEAELRKRDSEPSSVLVVRTDPWRYDPQLGAKESLIGEVLDALKHEVDEHDGPKEGAIALLKNLSSRVNWTKAFTIAAKASIALQLPKIDDVLGLLQPPTDDGAEAAKDMGNFRSQFEELLGSDALEHLHNVVILVDDLDRCLPDTVIESLEAIRLFLSVPKMSFVIAADEDRIAEAISSRFKGQPPTPTSEGDYAESPSRLYLHKIVQTSVPVPALSDFDTSAYLALLQLQAQVSEADFGSLIEKVAEARLAGRDVGDIAELAVPAYSEATAFAARIQPIVHEKTRGNPRRIKRFLNDLAIRLSIATKRGINLDPQKIAKLMVLEAYSPTDFGLVLTWLSENRLREQLAKLEVLTGQADQPTTTSKSPPTSSSTKTKPVPAKKATVAPAGTTASGDQEPAFSGFMIRWARMTPKLSDTDIAPYLVLAQSFTGETYFVAKALPEHLRDIASNLLRAGVMSSTTLVPDVMLSGLEADDATRLVTYLGEVVRDQPEKQLAGVRALLRIARHRAEVVEAAARAISSIPVQDVRDSLPVLFAPEDDQRILDAIKALVAASDQEGVASALEFALKPQ
jgi:hypothetical protein